MKTLFACAVALALFATVPAAAARGDNHQGNKRDAATQSTKSHSASGEHQNAPAGAITGGGHTRTGNTNGQGMMSGNRSSAGTSSNTMSGANNVRHNNQQGMMSGNRSSAGASSNTMSGANNVRLNNQQGMMSGNRSSAGTKTNSRNNSMQRNNSAPGNAVFGNTAGRQPTINSLRRNVQSSRHFRHGDYRAPQGYQPRHWTYGGRLPRAYFVRDYWIEDFLMFGLFEPPTDLIWVRVGNDALLVDRYSGDIVQVDYDVFY